MGTRVLIVEDDGDLREVVRQTLEDEGFQTIEASHGADALGYIRREAPDLVLTDLEMPIMDGWELLDEMERSGSTIPAVVMTAREDPVVDRTRTPVVSKPVDPAELLAGIRKCGVTRA
jgi:two-component system response regulator AdeR